MEIVLPSPSSESFVRESCFGNLCQAKGLAPESLNPTWRWKTQVVTFSILYVAALVMTALSWPE